MRIGIDASALVKEASGIGLWIINVLNNIMKIDNENEYFLFTYDDIKIPFELKENWQIVYYGGEKKKQIRYLTHMPKLLREYKIDVFVGTRHYLPPFNKNKVKYLAIVHDLIPLYMPELFTKEHKLRFRIFTDICKHQAHEVVAVSEATKRDVMKYMKIDEKHIHVVYEAANSTFTTERNEESIKETMERYNIDSKYVLCLSTVEPRKNMLRTIKAYEQCILKNNLPYKLVIVGGSGWNNGEIYDYVQQSEDLKKHVIFTGYVSNQDVANIYSNASLFIYASLCEGFGLPILEAMQCGIPVITSNISSMPEVAGDACELIDPYNMEQLQESITKILSDPNLQKRMVEKGIRQAKKFSWEKCAKEILDIIISMGTKK